MQRQALWNKLYLSGIDGRAAALARENGLGLEIAAFCYAPNLEDPAVLSAVRADMAGLDRFWFHAPFADKNSNGGVLLVQYQAGSTGLNLQFCDSIVYYSPCLRSDLFEQSKKRIHRIGQEKPCFYYYLTTRDSIEEKIYKVLETKQDYTEELFKNG